MVSGGKLDPTVDVSPKLLGHVIGHGSRSFLSYYSHLSANRPATQAEAPKLHLSRRRPHKLSCPSVPTYLLTTSTSVLKAWSANSSSSVAFL
jgi:hypothetical protein